ncbi:hypothetical protein AB1Y20_021532 [Prymnesium parvum]|uniref:Nucleolar GTP-binding protein 1 n=1 Tax=Prymnesium parvum TaxID=97485 RepID=A0AB34JMB1_PRYPA
MRLLPARTSRPRAMVFFGLLPMAGRAFRLFPLAPRAATPSPPPRVRHFFSAAPPDARAHSSLADLPDFRGPSRLLKEAHKQSLLVTPNPKVPNAKKRALRFAAQVVDAYAQGLSVPLREQLKVFQAVLRDLPPFEAALAELTLASLEREKGGKPLRAVVAEFDQLRRTVVRVGKERSLLASKAATIAEAHTLANEGRTSVADAFEEGSGALLTLIQTSQTLRKLPRPSSHEPVLVLVGMPNVGKSSIVTATSTGTPEINDYPFTTRRLKMGHVETADGGRYQVMDTPGVLSRPEEDRNPMEGLTLAAVKFLPSAVVFVMDLSGTCGSQSAPELQLAVRDQIRATFPDRPWLDVRSKADLPLADGVAESQIPAGTLSVSVHEGTNVQVLKERMAQLIADRYGVQKAPDW